MQSPSACVAKGNDRVNPCGAAGRQKSRHNRPISIIETHAPASARGSSGDTSNNRFAITLVNAKTPSNPNARPPKPWPARCAIRARARRPTVHPRPCGYRSPGAVALLNRRSRRKVPIAARRTATEANAPMSQAGRLAPESVRPGLAALWQHRRAAGWDRFRGRLPEWRASWRQSLQACGREV